jgi:hypothetical protein
LQTSRPALGSTQPPVQWVLCLSPGVNGRAVVLTTHSLLAPRSRRMSRAIPLHPLNTFQTCAIQLNYIENQRMRFGTIDCLTYCCSPTGYSRTHNHQQGASNDTNKTCNKLLICTSETTTLQHHTKYR